MTESDAQQRALTGSQKLTFSLPSLSVALSGSLFGSWLLFYYRPPADSGGGRVALVGAYAWTVAMILGRVVDALADPPVGYFSDRSRSRFGRRLPFVAVGTPLLALSFVALWFPPFDPGSLANDIYVVTTMCIYWFAFTVVVAPYLSLLPEIVPGDHERVVVSSLLAVWTVVGSAAGPALPGLLKGYVVGENAGGWLPVDDEYQAAAIVAGLFILVLCLLPLINIRERANEQEKSVPAGLWSGIRTAYQNPAFRAYVALVALLQMGLNLVVIVIPFLAKSILERPATVFQNMVEVVAPSFARGEVMDKVPSLPGLVGYGQGETWVAILMAEVMLGAALMFVPVTLVHKHMGKKRMFMLSGFGFGLLLLSTLIIGWFDDPAIPTLVIFGLMTFPVSVALVLPNAIFADVVDYDAQIHGYRREGIFNGATALVTKAGIGAAQAAAVWMLLLGDSKAKPTGIYAAIALAGAMIFLGLWMFRSYPIEK